MKVKEEGGVFSLENKCRLTLLCGIFLPVKSRGIGCFAII